MSIDQSMINLIDLIPTALKKVGQTGGGEYHGACPFCGGTDRFIVQPQKTANGGRWFCRQCGRHGDALAFVCDYEDLTVSEGLKRLNLIASQPLKRKPAAPQPVVYAADLDYDKYLCFDPVWQAAAKRFMVDCELALINGWHVSNAGRYLEGRGIKRKTAQHAIMGMNLTDYRDLWGDVLVWLPRGIVIPWTIDGQLWNVRIRRPNIDVEKSGGDKYISPKGSCGYAMYGIDEVQPGDTVFMTEGEFDALLLRRFLSDQMRTDVSVVSIGSNTGARLGKWTYRLAVAKKIYLAFDDDAAGDLAAGWWLAALGRKATRIRPSKKDITEMWQAGELPMFMKGIQ